MGHVTRWLWSTQLKSQLSKIGSHCPSEGRDKAFLKKSRDRMPMIDSAGEIPST